MKQLIGVATVVMFSCIAISVVAQSATSLSSVIKPGPFAGSSLTVPGPCQMYVSVNGGPNQTGTVVVAVGDTLTFGTSGSVGTEPTQVVVNGVPLAWGGGSPEDYQVDAIGEWTMSFTTPECGTVQELDILAQ